MAISIKYKSRFGLNVESAYMRVDQLFGNKSEMTAVFGLYATKETAEAGADAFDNYQFKFSPNLDGSNFIAQAYDGLKSTPDFANSQDC